MGLVLNDFKSVELRTFTIEREKAEDKKRHWLKNMALTFGKMLLDLVPEEESEKDQVAVHASVTNMMGTNRWLSLDERELLKSDIEHMKKTYRGIKIHFKVDIYDDGNIGYHLWPEQEKTYDEASTTEEASRKWR
jgi:hypothetical protein